MVSLNLRDLVISELCTEVRMQEFKHFFLAFSIANKSA